MRFDKYLIIIAVLFVSTASFGKIIYVDDDAAGVNDGSSWQNAYIYLQDALADANSSVKPVEILVAQGIYKPDQGVGQTAGDREATFELINDTTLSGGYGGIAEINPDEQDYEKYKTILSGDLAGNDIDVNDPNELLNEPTLRENTLYIVRNESESLIDGFTISGSYVGGRGGFGAGLWSSGNLQVTNCIFYRNRTYNGALCNSGVMTVTNCNFIKNFNSGLYSSEDITVIDCTFTDNTGAQGGAINIENKGKLTLSGCVFTNNDATEGGAIYSGSENPIIENCTFNNNSATNGGAIFIHYTSPVIRNCTFTGNSASRGGGVYNLTTLELSNCFFIDNIAEYGGGLYNNGNMSIRLCTFIGNLATLGGGIYNYKNISMHNCVLAENLAASDGGAIYTEQIYFITGIGIVNCTIVNNSAANGKAIASKYEANVLLSNSIVWNGTGAIFNESPSGITIKYSNIQDGPDSIYEFNDGLVWENNNIEIDPLFADPNNYDYHLKSQAGRWDTNTQSWITDDVTSPCIDAGDPNIPIGCEPFPNGGYINMGAYGGTAEASKSYFGMPVCDKIIAGDINGDCKVDELDLDIMMNHWLEDKSYFRNPITENGIEYYIQTDKSLYTLGENVQMLFRVTNKTSETVDISCSRFYPSEFQVQKDGTTVWQWPQVYLLMLGPDLILSPGESKESSGTWDMENNKGNIVSPGTYNVVGILYNEPWNCVHDPENYIPTQVRVTITIYAESEP